MTNQTVQLKIVLPQKMLPVQSCAKIVVPASLGRMTIIPDRAPTTLLLNNGVVEVLTEDNSVKSSYFIKGGVANIAADECVVMTEQALSLNEATLEIVQALKEEHLAELLDLSKSFPQAQDKKDSETEFYDNLIKYLKNKK